MYIALLTEAAYCISDKYFFFKYTICVANYLTNINNFCPSKYIFILKLIYLLVESLLGKLTVDVMPVCKTSIRDSVSPFSTHSGLNNLKIERTASAL